MTFEELIAKLPEGSFSDRAAVVSQIAATGDERAAAVLDALQAGDLAVRKGDGAVVRVAGRGAKAVAFDPLTGAELGPVPPRSTEAVKVNNALRRSVRSAISTLTLMAKDSGQAPLGRHPGLPQPRPRAARGDPHRPRRRERPGGEEGARRGQGGDGRGLGRRPAGAHRRDRGDRRSRRRRGPVALTQLQTADEPEVAEAAKAAVAGIARTQAMWNQAQNLWFGLSRAPSCSSPPSASPSPSG